MTVFQLLHWNGSLKAMRERQCSRQVKTNILFSVILKESYHEESYLPSSFEIKWFTPLCKNML